MASFEYSETYRETNLSTGLQREFHRQFRAQGDADEVIAITRTSFQFMPKYNYPLVESRETIMRKLLQTRKVSLLEE